MKHQTQLQCEIVTSEEHTTPTLTAYENLKPM